MHTYLGSVSPQLLRSYTNPFVSHDLFVVGLINDDGQSFLQNLDIRADQQGPLLALGVLGKIYPLTCLTKRFLLPSRLLSMHTRPSRMDGWMQANSWWTFGF